MNLLKIFLLFVFLTSSLFATSEHLRIKGYSTNLTPKAGEEFSVQLNFELDEYWYTYTIKEQLSPEGIGPNTTEIIMYPEGLVELVGEIQTPEPSQKYDEGFEMQLNYYNNKFSYVLNLKASKDLYLVKDELYAEVYIQICDTTSCLPAEAYNVYIKDIIEKTEIYYNAAKKDHKEIKSDDKNVTDSSKEIEEAKQKGVWSFLWLAITSGALALLTPCVFPMIPITVSFFTKRSEKANAKGLRDSTLFAVGIISTFTIFGFALALALGPTGIRDFATNPFVNLFIAAIFIVFALNLFGAFEIQVPTGIMNKLNAKSQGNGVGSIFLMGLVFSLTSFTCTVPFVGTALISSTGGEWFYPILGMLAFSATFSIPFFLFALFPSMLKTLPKAGGWMNNLKVVMGFLEIAAAIKFLSNADLVWDWQLLPRETFLSIWIACGVLIVVYVLGYMRMKLDSPVDHVGAVRAIWAIVFASISVYLLSGLYGRPLGELDAFLPPANYGQSAGYQSMGGGSSSGSSYDESEWYKDYDKALEIAKKENKMMFLDFTGWTCTNCRWMEANLFPDKDISGMMKDMVKVKLYTDRRKEPELTYKKMQEDRFNSIDLPLYVIQDPNENVKGTKVFTRDKGEFVDFLGKGVK